MEFKTVQQKDTLEIIMYFVNKVRVNKYDYKDYLQREKIRNVLQTPTFTHETKKGNFVHRFYTSI
jgi:hypothetical protein